MAVFSFLVAVVLLTSCAKGEERELVSVIRTALWEYQIVSGPHPEAIMESAFSNLINQTGWSLLEIKTKDTSLSDEEIAFAAGFVEGVQTGELIHMSYVNMIGLDRCIAQSSLCEKVNSFLDENLSFMKENIEKNPQSSYWHQIKLYLKQLEGLEKGYYNNTQLPSLPPFAFKYLQYDQDIADFTNLFKGERPFRTKVKGSGSCSAIVKVLPQNEDLLTSHDTWSEYQSMLRIYKLYDLPYKLFNGSDTVVSGRKIAFSSYPGKLQSEDDYYIMSNKLVTMETTNEVSDPSIWKYLSPRTVMEPIRVMTSNRLATSGSEWSDIFSRLNSGTYNNQWMIVDYNKFVSGAPLPQSDLLWVLEQMPGMVVSGDQTRVLIDKSYWASYNIPFYPEIAKWSGNDQDVARYGNAFSHDNCPRALIFARNHTQVTDVDSLFALMRYNNYQHDPLSACNCTPPYSAEYAISARSDLNPPDGHYPIDFLGHRIHGGTDNKITNSEMVERLISLATSGPTYVQQPLFRWSTSGVKTPLGHPDAFHFPPVIMSWSLTDKN